MSLVRSQGWNSTNGLSSTKSKRRRVPSTKLVTIRPGCTLLAPVRDDARLDEIDHAVGEHLGVDAEIVLVEQAPQHRVGDRADAHLQRGAVGHERGDVLADGVLDRRRRRRARVSCSGRSVWTNAVTPIDGTSVLPCVRGIRSLISAITMRAVCGRGQRGVDRGAERAVAVAVGRGQLQQRDVERDRAGEEQPRDVREEDRHEVRAAPPTALRTGGPVNSDTETKPALVLGIDERRRDRCVQVIERESRGPPPRQGFEQRRGRRRGAVHEHAHAARDPRHRVISSTVPGPSNLLIRPL